MRAVNDKAVPFHPVFGDLIAVQRVKLPLSVCRDLTLHDFHEFSLAVLKLLGEHHDRECLRYKVHQHLIIHVIFSLAQCPHSAVSGFTTVAVDRGKHRVSGSCRFLCRVRLRTTHLPDTDDLRVETQCHIEEHVLINILLFIFAVSGQRMDDTVGHFSILFPYKCQLTAAVFDGKDALSIRYGGKQPACKRGLSRTGCSCNTDADSITQALCQKIQHFPCCGAAIHKVFLFQALRIDNTDGRCNPHIFIHKRRL